MFILKVTKKVETETGVVLTLTPQGEGLSGEIFVVVGLDTEVKTGDILVANKQIEETIQGEL